MAVPPHSAVQLYLASLNVAELHSSAVECRGLRGSSSIRDNGVHYYYIFTTNHLGNTFIFFVLNTDRSSPNASNKVGIITTEKDRAVAPSEVGTG